uniref:Centromere protein J C-terminal domain-containing protein n=1 Tax=Sphenodon punctatus TaxID=8508 RepID=A0A8D0G7I4_SPHPU
RLEDKSVKIHKLQKEKVEFERYTTTAQVTRENEKAEEIQMLKQQIAGLQEEFRRNESHWQAAHGKLRNQIDTLTKQNLELQDELRVSEHQRLEAKGQSGATKNTLQRAESLKSTTREHREKMSSSTLHRKSVMPTGRKTPLEGRVTPFEFGVKKIPNSLFSFQIYYYADAQTAHTTYPSGLEVLRFPNNQIEKHYPDGTKEIVFPDQTVKRFSESGLEETVFPDGTVVKVEKNGDKMVLFSNGQKEIHTAQFKRREYPDGTIKTVYSSGQQETKYSSGRVRIKDEEGNIILDKK